MLSSFTENTYNLHTFYIDVPGFLHYSFSIASGRARPGLTGRKETDKMEKYKRAFEQYAHMVALMEKGGIDRPEAMAIWRKFWEGIRCVAIYDNDITSEAFEDMLTWNNKIISGGIDNE